MINLLAADKSHSSICLGLAELNNRLARVSAMWNFVTMHLVLQCPHTEQSTGFRSSVFEGEFFGSVNYGTPFTLHCRLSALLCINSQKLSVFCPPCTNLSFLWSAKECLKSMNICRSFRHNGWWSHVRALSPDNLSVKRRTVVIRYHTTR